MSAKEIIFSKVGIMVVGGGGEIMAGCGWWQQIYAVKITI